MSRRRRGGAALAELVRSRPPDESVSEGARQVARELVDEVTVKARERYPERYAPDGSALYAMPGSTWAMKRLYWEMQQAQRAGEGGHFFSEGSQKQEAAFPRERNAVEPSEADPDAPYDRVRGDA